jgi:hypothetical protein
MGRQESPKSARPILRMPDNILKDIDGFVAPHEIPAARFHGSSNERAAAGIYWLGFV